MKKNYNVPFFPYSSLQRNNGMKRFTLRELILFCVLSVLFTVGLVVLMMHYLPRTIDSTLSQLCLKLAPYIDQKASIYEKRRDLQKKIPAGQANILADDIARLAPVPFNPLKAYLLEKSDYYRNLPTQDLQEKRLADQAKILEDYEKDPAAFVNEYQGIERIFLFDAVVDGKNLLRVGRFGDGGKWLSDPQRIKPGAVVYSFGIGDDISFDVEMAGQFGCEVHAFDPAPSVVWCFPDYRSGQAVGKGKFWYHPVGLGPISTKPGESEDLVIEGKKCPSKRLSEIAAALGHQHVDVLKIDIEGGEMAALLEILSSRTLEKLSVKQLLVEFHLWNDEQWISFVHIINLLREHGYLIFRKELNPLDNRCAEFAFLGPE
jgi:hypothetical protein